MNENVHVKFLKQIEFNKNNFNILYTNIRSIRKKLDEVEAIINSYNCVIHVLILTEVWLKRDECVSFNLLNYNSIYSVREKEGGGLAIYVHKSLQFELLKEVVTQGNNLLLVKINKVFNKDIKIGAVYKPPNSSVNDFLNDYDKFLENVSDAIIFGDYNIDLLKQCNLTENYVNIVNSNGFKLLNQINSENSTRPLSKSILDHVSSSLLNIEYEFGMKPNHLSDHNFISLSLNIKTAICSSTIVHKINYQKVNETIQSDLTNKDFSSFSDLFNNVKSIIENNKKIVNVKIKTVKPKWISSEINTLLSEKQLLYKKSLKWPMNSEILRQYKKIKNDLKTKIIYSKKNYYSNQFYNNINNPYKTWKVINQIMYNKDNSKQNVDFSSVKFNGQSYVTDLELANALNSHFISAGNVSQNPTLNTMQLENTLCFQDNTMYLNQTSEFEIRNIIKRLNGKSAVGSDSVNAQIIKNNSNVFAPQLSKLINKNFEKCEFPIELKIAKVISLHKGGQKEDPGNIRPISIPTSFSKIYENVIHSRMVSFAKKFKLINENQFGFVEKSNTTTAVINLVTELQTAIDKKKSCSVMFIDLKKAFDSISHSRLLFKLGQLGYRGHIQHILADYLKDRQQYVQYNHTSSKMAFVTRGVPQGSILGPLLFILYVNDLFNLNLKGKLQMYADDAAIIYNTANDSLLYEAMESDMKTIYNWVQINELCINIKKTCYVQITPKNKSYLNRSLFLNGQLIDKVKEYKYLGFTIDEKLTWYSHIKNLKRKICMFIGALRRVQNYISSDCLKQLYFAHVHSHLMYMCSVWSGTYKTKLAEVQITQNKALRTVFYVTDYKNNNVNTNDIYHKYKIMNIRQLSFYDSCLLFYKMKNELTRTSLQFRKVREMHNYSTRSSNNIYVEPYRTNFGAFSFITRSSSNYNSIQHICENPNFNKFKTNLKKYVYSEL